MSNETQINVINNAGTSRIPFFQWNQESLHLFAKETLHSLSFTKLLCQVPLKMFVHSKNL